MIRVDKLKAGIFDSLVFSITLLVLWFDLSVPEVDDSGILRLGFERGMISILVALVVTLVIQFLNFSTLGDFWRQLKDRAQVSEPDQFNFVPIQVLFFLTVIIIAGLKVVHFSIFELLDRDGFAGAGRLFTGMAQPKMEIIPKAIVNMVQTVFMAFMATLLAAPAAFILSFFAARNVMNQPVTRGIRQGLRFVLNLVSSVESLIWAIIFSVWVGIGPFAGVLALTVHSIVSLARGFSELIEVTSTGPVESIRSTGANQIQVVWFGIFPQVILPFLSHTIYRWDVNIRMATIVGLVGGGGIGTLMIQNLGQGLWHELGSIILVISMTVWVLDFLSSVLRQVLK